MPNKLSDYPVVITRAVDQGEGFALALRQRGLTPLFFPVIELRTVKANNQTTAMLFELFAEQFTWLVFTSENGVTHLVKYLEMNELENAIPNSTKIAVVGDKTEAAVRSELGRLADLKPQSFDAAGLAGAFGSKSISGERILIVRGNKGKETLAEGLRALHASIAEITLYENVLVEPDPKTVEKLKSQQIANLVFTFFSPSALSGTLEVLGDDQGMLAEVKIASIGKATSEAVVEAGFSVWLEASKPSEAILANEIAQALSFAENR